MSQPEKGTNPPQANQPQLMTVEEAASVLRVDPKTVYRLINNNELKAVLIGRVYRIDSTDLEDFLRRAKLKTQRAPKKKY